MKLELLKHFLHYCPAIQEYIWNSSKRIKKDVDDAIILRVILQFYDREKLYNSRTLSNIAITHLLVILVAPSSSCIQLIKDSIKFTSSSHHKWALFSRTYWNQTIEFLNFVNNAKNFESLFHNLIKIQCPSTLTFWRNKIFGMKQPYSITYVKYLHVEWSS